MTDNLNPQQFAKYSSVDRYDTGLRDPLPASMERHAPGEYQPTLPGMESMLKGEQTHTSVVFKHPVEAERWKDNTGEEHLGDVPNSNWYGLTSTYHPSQVKAPATSLRPTQDWLDDNYLNSPVHPRTLANQGTRPKVERIGRKNVIQDGHHRAAREILSGKKSVDIDRWGGKD